MTGLHQDAGKDYKRERRHCTCCWLPDDVECMQKQFVVPVGLLVYFSCGNHNKLNLHLTHGVHIPNGISIGSAVFAGLTIVTDGPTDRQTDHATQT